MRYLPSSVDTHKAPARQTGLILAIAVHFGIVMFVWNLDPARTTLAAMAPLMVELIKPELPDPPTPKPEPKVELPKPLPVKKLQPRPEPEPAILVAQTSAAAAVQVAPPPELKPAPPVDARPVAPVPPAPVIPPIFNADYLHNPAPVYPALSRRMGEEGRVLIRAFVEGDGAPLKVELRTSSGSERLDQSALDAVRRWKFVPAKQGDKAVAAWVVVPVVFSLKG